MFRIHLPALLAVIVGLTPVVAHAQDDAVDDLGSVLEALNDHGTINVSSDARSYEVIFDAYLDLTDPPFPIDEFFNHRTIHSEMSDWADVVDWAESNQHMAEALQTAKDRTVFGMPYGRDNVDGLYRDAGLYTAIAVEDVEQGTQFPYLRAIETIAAFGTAESYRLLSEGQIEDGLEVMVSTIWLLRQCCDRQFLDEKMRSIRLLSDMLSNLRDAFYTYRDQITADRYTEVCRYEIEWLRPTRDRLEMPEGDRIVAEAIIRRAFDDNGQADADRFMRVFGAMQAQEKPLTRFGAARHWQQIASVHASLEASIDQLNLIYDDWWRRWRVQEYDPILDLPSQFERTNRVYYGAVYYAMQDIQNLFDVRNALVAQVNGTAMSAGLCAYYRTFNTYPSEQSMVYAQFVRKLSDVDPYDQDYDTLRYRTVSQRHAIDGPYGRVWIEPGQALLYSRGQNNADDRGREHTTEGITGDIVLWPPIRAVSREAGLID